MTVGTVLKQAREQAGLSAEQISERTKIQLYKIEALEEDDFSRLPEGIYLDGIIRAYSREVGINSEAMVARARIERGKRPGDWEVPFSAPIDLRGASRPNDRRSHRRSRLRRSVRFIRDRAPNRPIRRRRHRSRRSSNSRLGTIKPIDAPPPAERHDPVIVQAPVAPPHRRRRRPVLALLASLCSSFLGAYLYDSNRALERNDRAPSTPRQATDVEVETPKTEPPRLQMSPVSLRMQLRKTPRSLPPLRNPDRRRIAPLIRALRLRRRTSQPNLRAPHRQHRRETSQQAGHCRTWPARGR